MQEKLKILVKMNQDGYFKTIEEYLKAKQWILSNRIPEWFESEMKEYEEERKFRKS